MASMDSEKRFVENWLDGHEDHARSFVERWLQAHSHQARVLLEKLCNQGNTTITKPLGAAMEEGKLLNHCISTPNLHSNRKKRSASELRKMDRHQLFMELLQDVVSPDMDVNSLSHKILVNVLLLTNADRSSLFLMDGGTEDSNPILVSRLFDVMEGTTVEDAVHEEADAIKIPVGVGIAGHAAKTGETINLQNAYEDPRFNTSVDRYTGYKTKSILCMPIKAPDGQVIGVAQVINKSKGEEVFTSKDEEDFRTYLNFCAIGLLNAQLLDQSFTLSRQLQVLLQLARGLFEDTTSLEVVVRKIMVESQELVPCERCTVMLIDQENKEEIVFNQAFEMDQAMMHQASQASIRSLDTKTISDLDLAKQVASTTQAMSVNNIDMTEAHLPVDKGIQSVLCMPIFDKDGNTIGVIKLTNKLDRKPFDKADQELFEVFATFCGLGIHSVMSYEKILKANAKQSVALEVLSYHASSSLEEAQRVMQLPVPETTFQFLSSFIFDDISFSEDETILASFRMFTQSGLLEKFSIDKKVLYRWLLTVKKNYRPVTYHNWRHAFNVAQIMFATFTSGKLSSKLTSIEQLALLIGCFCHDLDHRGTNNAFQIKKGNALATLYSTSTMEHHHFDHCIMILNSTGNEVLNGLTAKQYELVIKLLENAILSTDLAIYFKKKSSFQDLVKQSRFNWSDESHRDLLRGMLMTACDIAAITKPWEIQQRVAWLVASEFFEQGDQERNDLKSEPIAMMDRKKKHELPKMQVGFIDAICMPLYEILAELLEDLNPLLEGVRNNRKEWQALADRPRTNLSDSEKESPTSTTVVSKEKEREQRDNLSRSRPGPVIAWRSDSEGQGSPPRAHQSVPKCRKLKCTLF